MMIYLLNIIIFQFATLEGILDLTTKGFRDSRVAYFPTNPHDDQDV